jgi:tripartite-type tricarboxylate transporter receptor subunit TctC
VNRLHNELDAILKLPEVRSVFSKAGLDAASSTPAELTDVVGKDYKRWGEVIQRNSIAAE